MKFQNKYRIESNRMPGWDYAGNGMYFITIMIRNRKCILGKIHNNEMFLSDFGEIINNEWCKSFEIRQELILDEYIITPNHLHAIVVIEKLYEPHEPHVETHGRASLHSHSQPQSPTELHRKPKSLSSFIAGYKSATTNKIDDWIDLHNDIPQEKYNRRNKLWQSGYHDHIIRNDHEYRRIKEYIINNPRNWVIDKFHK